MVSMTAFFVRANNPRGRRTAAMSPCPERTINTKPPPLPDMITTSRLNPMRALRGLRFLVLAIAIATALATTSTALAGKGFNELFNPIASDGTFTNNGWRFENSPSEPGTTIPANLSYSLSPDHSTLTLVISSPAGVASAGLSLNSVQYLQEPPNVPPGPISFSWTAVFSENVKEGQLGFLGSQDDSGARDLDFEAGVVYGGRSGSVLGGNIGWTPTSDNVVTCTITITKLTWGQSQIVFAKGDAVPGVPDANFTAFGIPATSNFSGLAVLAKWTSPAGRGSGIILNGKLLIKVGDEIPSGSGVRIKSLKDPVADGPLVAFPAMLTGSGISAANDSAVISNAPDRTLRIVAQEGTQAPDAPTGALWRSFSSVAVPGFGHGVMILGFMQQGPGGITAANDNGLWVADETGAFRLRIQEGTTVVGSNTVKSFTALTSVSGSPGQTHSFNSSGDLVARVTYTTGAQALVKFTKPHLYRSFRVRYSGASFGNTAVADGVMTIDAIPFAQFANPGFDFYIIGAGGSVADLTLTISNASAGNGTFTLPDLFFYYITTFDALDLDTEWVGQAQPSQGTTWGAPGSDGTAGDFGFFGVTPDAPTGTTPFQIATNGGLGDSLTLTSVTPLPYSPIPTDYLVLFQKGDAVPGVPNAKFTGFGLPAINPVGEVAFLGKWKSPAGSGSGIFAAGKLVAKVGDDLSAGAGTQILKSLMDPVISEGGYVTFPAALKGSGITSTNSRALVSNYDFGAFPANASAKVVAQQGTPAAGTVDGVYRSFLSVAMPHTPMWLATLENGGSINAGNKLGLWTSGSLGVPHLVLQSGTTVVEGKTVRSFEVLKAVGGSPGQTHGFNTFGAVFSQVTFTDGSQAIVQTFPPDDF